METYVFRGKEFKTEHIQEKDFFLDYSVSDDWLYIEAIVVNKQKREQGNGERVLQMILEQFSEKDVYLLATGELGSDEARLKQWYGRHGFVATKDKNDLPFNYNMVLRRKK